MTVIFYYFLRYFSSSYEFSLSCSYMLDIISIFSTFSFMLIFCISVDMYCAINRSFWDLAVRFNIQ